MLALSRAIVCLHVALLPAVSCQFGNAQVNWENSNPTVTTPKAPEPSQHLSLEQLPKAMLTDILNGLNAKCATCETHGHYVSRIRSACLSLGPKALKAQLALRNVRCDGCTMREHYLDRVLDTVHILAVRK